MRYLETPWEPDEEVPQRHMMSQFRIPTETFCDKKVSTGGYEDLVLNRMSMRGPGICNNPIHRRTGEHPQQLTIKKCYLR